MTDDLGKFRFPLRAFVKSSAGRQSLVLSPEATRDEMQLSGRWIASTDVREVRR